MQASAAFAIEKEEDLDFDPELEQRIAEMKSQETIEKGLKKIKRYLKKVEKEYGYMDSEIAVVALGDCYREGKEGVEQDDEKAVMCYEEATEYDCIDGVQMFGVCVFEGRGVEQDYEQAFSLLSREYMEGGNALIFRYRGLCCFNGWGTEQDLKEAMKWYKAAAKLGNEDAEKRMQELQK